MVALVAGLVVTGAAVAFTMSSLRANTSYISSTRLTQELRVNLNIVTDELRRAGYDEGALAHVARPPSYTGFSRFATLSIANNLDGDATTTDDCVVYAYDRLPGSPGGMPELSNGEIRAFRLMRREVNGVNVGVLEFSESTNSGGGYTPACGGGSPNYSTYPASCANGWCAVSDPRIVDIVHFGLADPTSPATQLPNMRIRRMDVDMRGRLIGAPETMRGVRATVRVRADCVRANPGTNCTAAPTGT